jgi:lipid-binding SYLF domain-containing protein
MNRRELLGAAAGAALLLALGDAAVAASAAELNADADQTMELLKQSEPVTQEMIDAAKGILIFPKIVKGGLLVGAASGKGVLRVDGKTEGFFQSTAVSYGLQAGVSKFGYVMFLMDDEALT